MAFPVDMSLMLKVTSQVCTRGHAHQAVFSLYEGYTDLFDINCDVYALA